MCPPISETRKNASADKGQSEFQSMLGLSAATGGEDMPGAENPEKQSAASLEAFLVSSGRLAQLVPTALPCRRHDFAMS